MLKIDNPEALLSISNSQSVEDAISFILGEPCATGTITTNSSKKSIKFTTKGIKLFGSTVEHVTLDFNFSKKTLDIMSFVLPPSSQGKGVLKMWLKKVVSDYEARGISNITVSANLQAGGYAWARMGFNCMDTAESEALADSVLEKLESLGVEEDDISDYIRDNSTKLDLPFKLATIKFPKIETSLKSKPNIKKLFPSGVPITLGKILLFKQSWDGKLNLKNTAQKTILFSAIKT